MSDVVVVVTRNGLGDMWLFSSRQEADLHPIVQYGDVVCDGPASMLRQYTRLEVPDLLARLGDMGFRSEVLMQAASPTGWAETMSRRSPRMWEMMVALARRPPTDPAEICSVVTRDRKLSIVESGRRGVRSMTEETSTAEATEAKEKKKKKTRKPRVNPDQPKTVGGFPLTAKITLLCDKDGNPYGPENNPKQKGSATHERFKVYANGITVEEAYKGGVAAGDFSYDVNKGFIKIDV